MNKIYYFELSDYMVMYIRKKKRTQTRVLPNTSPYKKPRKIVCVKNNCAYILISNK